jgi:hypothetical protein
MKYYFIHESLNGFTCCTFCLSDGRKNLFANWLLYWYQFRVACTVSYHLYHDIFWFSFPSEMRLTSFLFCVCYSVSWLSERCSIRPPPQCRDRTQSNRYIIRRFFPWKSLQEREDDEQLLATCIMLVSCLA